MTTELHNAEMLRSANVYRIEETPTIAALRLSTDSGDHFFLATKQILQSLSIELSKAADSLEETQ